MARMRNYGREGRGEKKCDGRGKKDEKADGGGGGRWKKTE